MTLRIEELPSLSPSGFGGVRARRIPGLASGTSRRDFLRGAIAAGAGLGLATLSLLPTAKPAKAQHGAWSIRPSCSGIESFTGDDNCDGCDLPGSPACCCVDGFFDDSGCDKKHRPNQCPIGSEDDGWRWSTGACCIFNCNPGCNCSTNREWRCSDGWKRMDCGVAYSAATDKRICRVVVSAGTSPCPGGCPD